MGNDGSVEESDYMKYRGKCREFCEAAIQADSTLTLVRGHYFDPCWGMQGHWWTVRQDGTIYDPTKDQFPSKGTGAYVPFDGWLQCVVCEKEFKEKDAYGFVGNEALCSYECYCRYCL